MLHFSATTAAAARQETKLGDSLKHFIKLPPSVCCYVSQFPFYLHLHHLSPFHSLSYPLPFSSSCCAATVSRVAYFRFLGTNPALSSTPSQYRHSRGYKKYIYVCIHIYTSVYLYIVYTSAIFFYYIVSAVWHKFHQLFLLSLLYSFFFEVKVPKQHEYKILKQQQTSVERVRQREKEFV